MKLSSLSLHCTEYSTGCVDNTEISNQLLIMNIMHMILIC